MRLDADEVDFERSLASLSPAMTDGIESVPAREMSVRAGRATARRKARIWQGCAVLLAAGLASAMFLRPSSPTSEVVFVPSETAATTDLSDAVRAMAQATPGQSLVLSRGVVVLTDPETPRKIVFMSSGPGEITLNVVPESWKVYDH
jgi:hypothetical protein